MLIITKHLPVTETKGLRVQAKMGNKKAVLAWDYALEPFGNHRRAFEKLAIKGDFAFSMVDGVGYWVSTDRVYSGG